MGRHSTYTPEIAQRICERIAAGDPLTVICREPGMPTTETVRVWEREDREGFSAIYAQARQAQADHYFDQVVEIADQPMTDAVEVQAAKLRVDSRKWVLARMNRAKYGDHASLNVGGQAGNTLEVKHAVDLSKLSEEQRDALAKIGRELATGGEG